MSGPIRVLHVFHGMDCGGAENMIMNLYRNIDRRKVQFDFLVHTKKKCFFDDEIKNLGGRIFHVPYYNVKNHFTYKKVLMDFFNKHSEIKIVHGHLGSCAHVYLDVAKSFGCYTIAHSHNTLPTDRNIKNLLYRIFTLRTRMIPEYFMACGTQAGIDRFGKKIVSSNKFSVLNNAIDTKKYIFNESTRDEIRRNLGVSDNYVIGHIGRFNYQKNHKFLIDVFYEIQKKHSDSRLLLVGDGDLRQNIEVQVKTLGISDKVIMTGVRNDVPDLLQAMDCFVFPSHYEGLGIVAVEAQAAGLLSVVSEAIVPEADMQAGLMTHLNLNDSIDKWVNAVESGVKTKRTDTSRYVVSAGFDITKTVDQLTKFYLAV